MPTAAEIYVTDQVWKLLRHSDHLDSLSAAAAQILFYSLLPHIGISG
jgi:hypothetical protein